ncbi:UNVERIFIED_CONTAM: hypothetical protein Sradi_6873500 [Sesamum radiatum]|uniref:Uncharacterized protein n=1 Tax=Sesamum radiatum TaxID=300843 RepID=A0AAW2JKE3_SESRA
MDKVRQLAGRELSPIADRELAGCELAGSQARRSRAHQPADSWKAEIAGFSGGKV